MARNFDNRLPIELVPMRSSLPCPSNVKEKTFQRLLHPGLCFKAAKARESIEVENAIALFFTQIQKGPDFALSRGPGYLMRVPARRAGLFPSGYFPANHSVSMR